MTLVNPPDETFTQTIKGFGKIVERITPWLLDLGSWVFGALIAFDLLVLGSLLTVGPVDPAVLVATAAIALALPPTVAGFFVLRLLNDMKTVRLEDVAAEAFQEVGFRLEGQIPSEDALERTVKQRTQRVLVYSYVTLMLSVLLTVTAITAALWHMAWWISLSFLATTVVSQSLVLGAIATSPRQPRR